MKEISLLSGPSLIKVSHGYLLRVYGAAVGSLQELVRLYDEFGMSNIQKE